MMTHHSASSCAEGTNTSSQMPVSSMTELTLCVPVTGGFENHECIDGVPMMKMYTTADCTGEGLAPVPIETCQNIVSARAQSHASSPPSVRPRFFSTPSRTLFHP